jgi:hypothetical protein
MGSPTYSQTADEARQDEVKLGSLGSLELSDRLARLRLALKPLEAQEKATTLEVKSRLEKDSASVPGWKLTPGASTTWNHVAIAAALGLSETAYYARFANTLGYSKVTADGSK